MRNMGHVRFWNLYKDRNLVATRWALKYLSTSDDTFAKYVLRCGVSVAEVVPAPETGKLTNMYSIYDVFALKHAMKHRKFAPIEDLKALTEVRQTIKEYEARRAEIRAPQKVSPTQKKLIRDLEFEADVEFFNNRLNEEEKKYIYVDKKKRTFVLDMPQQNVKTSRIRVHDLIPLKYGALSK